MTKHPHPNIRTSQGESWMSIPMALVDFAYMNVGFFKWVFMQANIPLSH